MTQTTGEASRPAGGRHSRPCPALGAPISSGDCGSRRGSDLNCPTGCPFFPLGLANPDLWFQLDTAWRRKAAEYVLHQLGRPEFEHLVGKLRVPVKDRDLEFECAVTHAVHAALFLLPQADGQLLVDRWEAAGFPGLNNDERVLTRHRRTTRPTVLEVERILADDSLRCVDLFAPEAGVLVVWDRAAALQLARFSRLFTWVTDYPHGSRLSGSAVTIGHALWPVWRSELGARREAALASTPELSWSRYLAANLVDSLGLLKQADEHLNRQLLENLDLHRCRALYRLAGEVEAVRTELAARNDFEAVDVEGIPELGPDRGAFVWLQRGDSAGLAPEPASPGETAEMKRDDVPLIGHVWLYEGRLLLESFSRRKYGAARERLPQILGDRLSLEGETSDNLADLLRQRADRERQVAEAANRVYAYSSSPPPASGPPVRSTPATSPAAALAEHEKRYTTFLDEPVAALHGLTPRAAAADPAHRDELLEVMKAHVHDLDRRNRRDGTQLEIGAVLDTLGLSVLK